MVKKKNSLFLFSIQPQDLFVFFNAWEHYRYIKDPALRLSFTYKRATKATFCKTNYWKNFFGKNIEFFFVLVTSFTTASAFAANIASTVRKFLEIFFMIIQFTLDPCIARIWTFYLRFSDHKLCKKKKNIFGLNFFFS
jgi:hypothetical protein